MALVQRKINVGFTHLSREYDENHTSWTEIIAFKNLFNHRLDVKTYIDNIEHICQNELSQLDQLYIFATGQLNKSIKKYLNNFKGSIYLIIQDPNWSVDFHLNRDYTLMTPFRRWSNMEFEIDQIYDDMNLLKWSLSRFNQHIYFPFGLMALYDSNYASKYLQSKYNDYLYQDFDEYYIYAGSLKEDRKIQLQNAVKLSNVAFYGNFNNLQLKDLMQLSSLNHCDCKGKVSPYLIPHLYGKYGTSLLMPDFLMNYLDVSYIRYYEIYLSQILYDASSLLITDNDHNKQLAKANMINFATFYDDLLEIDLDKLIDYFEDGINVKRRIYQLLY